MKYAGFLRMVEVRLEQCRDAELRCVRELAALAEVVEAFRVEVSRGMQSEVCDV